MELIDWAGNRWTLTEGKWVCVCLATFGLSSTVQIGIIFILAPLSSKRIQWLCVQHCTCWIRYIQNHEKTFNSDVNYDCTMHIKNVLWTKTFILQSELSNFPSNVHGEAKIWCHANIWISWIGFRAIQLIKVRKYAIALMFSMRINSLRMLFVAMRDVRYWRHVRHPDVIMKIEQTNICCSHQNKFQKMPW